MDTSTSMPPGIARREALARQAAVDLETLTAHPDRHVGGVGNRSATEHFARRVSAQGLEVSVREFECLEWEHGDAVLEVGDRRFEIHVGPYSHPVEATGPLVVAESIEDLENAHTSGAVVLLRGGIAAGQVMPKNFTFYNPAEHRRIVAAVESSGAVAVVAATGRDPQMVGSQYPFPLFEDGDLTVPTAYMTDVDGEMLAEESGKPVRVRLESRRIPAVAEHVVATRTGSEAGRVVVTAHIDSRKGSPGALDNAAGVAVLLALAELLADYDRGPFVELVPFNGEDNYANPGEMLWVADNEGRFDDIVVGINIDDAGLAETRNHVSFYGCPDEIEQAARAAIQDSPSAEEGPQWFQSDHAIFGIYGRPAIAVTSSEIERFMASFAHTELDTVEHADPALLADAALLIRDLIGRLAAI